VTETGTNGATGATGAGELDGALDGVGGVGGAAEPLLAVEELSLWLPTERGEVQILDEVTLSVDSGEMVGLAGESGSGKTMLALTIMRLLGTDRARLSGRVLFGGRDLLTLSKQEMQRVRGAEIGMVFQEPMTSLHPAWTVGEQIAEGIRAHEQVTRPVARSRAVEMLDLVGIPAPAERARQYPFQLSGGMQQRVMMAVALACRPRLLIADEPTTALDVTIQAQIVELVKQLQFELGMAVVFVTHDLGLLAGLAQRLVIMYGGQVVEAAPTADQFLSPGHPYTQALMLAAPHPDLKGTRLPSIPGAPPRPDRLPTGCRFHPRCAHATEACAEAAVPITRVSPTHEVRCLRHGELDLRSEVEAVL
jgi:peptide/nickel transport system ATP-binding protein